MSDLLILREIERLRPGISASKAIDLAERAIKAGIEHDPADDTFFTPGGMSLVSFIFENEGSAPSEVKPTNKPDDLPSNYGPYSADEFAKLRPDDRLRILAETEGKPTGNSPAFESWRNENPPVSLDEALRFSGLNAEEFRKLSPEQKLALDNEIKHNRKTRQ